MFGRATITLGIGPHSSFVILLAAANNVAVPCTVSIVFVKHGYFYLYNQILCKVHSK